MHFLLTCRVSTRRTACCPGDGSIATRYAQLFHTGKPYYHECASHEHCLPAHYSRTKGNWSSRTPTARNRFRRRLQRGHGWVGSHRPSGGGGFHSRKFHPEGTTNFRAFQNFLSSTVAPYRKKHTLQNCSLPEPNVCVLIFLDTGLAPSVLRAADIGRQERGRTGTGSKADPKGCFPPEPHSQIEKHTSQALACGCM